MSNGSEERVSPGTLTTYGGGLRAPVGRIHGAGAERAADAVLRAGTTRLRSEIPDGDTGAAVAAQRLGGIAAPC